jgi:hypothetical protein
MYVTPINCWKKDDYLPGEWPVALLSQPYEYPLSRHAGGSIPYMKYPEHVYGEKTHTLHAIPGVGHNTTGMFGSPIGLEELFN